MIPELCKKAKSAALRIANSPTNTRNEALKNIADSLWADKTTILSMNAIDLEQCQKAEKESSFLDRLTLTESRLTAIIDDVHTVARLPDPVGERFDEKVLPNGIKLWKQRVPIGVLAVIYEARPNVTVDIATLSIKSGNAAILRGGSESLRSNRALVGSIQKGLASSNLTPDIIQFIDNPDRGLVLELLKMYDTIDMLIPRGAASLHKFCRENSMIPVITGGMGICHLFVDESADLERSLSLIQNAKVQRPTVCNALDTVLVHRAIARNFLPRLARYLEKDGVVLHLDESAQPFLVGMESPNLIPAGENDFDTEWLSLHLGVRVVADLNEAIAHIHTHSTQHSDGILTADETNANAFLKTVDSAAVYVNASTRFTDGGQFGLGAEVAISTQRLHARGPMGLQELTTYKWVAIGDYHIRP